MGEEGAAIRDARPAAPPVWAPVGNRWAVVVGISAYRDRTLNLSYAHRDARALAELLGTPEGGGFEPARIQLLLDKKATTAAVTRAVNGFLIEAAPDDLVLLFFACHGGPDPRRPAGPLYLYTHDTDPRNVAGTAFPMDDIDRALRQLVQAQRVVILADTCHSGALGGGPRTRGTVTAEATNRYLDALARAKGGVALLTSAEAAEASQEDARWGKGHGVFTHYVLQGMRGAADGYRGEKDGIVSVGELFEYVRDQVQRDTDGAQHPMTGPALFDRMLPMAVTGDLQVEQYLALGRSLIEVGWLLDDPAPMLLAARQFALATELRRGLPAADAEYGSALLAAGEADAAAVALTLAVAAAPGGPDPWAWRDLGLAEAERGRPADAAAALTTFLEAAPDHADAAWVQRYADWLTRPPGGLRALVIGVGTFPPGSTPHDLPGVANDLDLVVDLLRTTLGVAPERITTLQDEEATLDGVRGALDRLHATVQPDDAVVVYFTGHSVTTAGADDAFLITYADLREGPVGLTPRELVSSLELSCREVVLVLDTHISPAFVALAGEQERIVTLLGCGVGEVAYEMQIDGVPHGLFTASLAAELRQGTDVTYGTLMERVRRQMHAHSERMGQTPRLAGRRDGLMFAGHYEDADLWRALRRATPRAADEAVLARAAELGLPAARWARARRLLADGRPDLALRWLPPTDAGGPDRWARATDTAIAHLELGQTSHARTVITAASDGATGRPAAEVASAVAALDAGTLPAPTVVVLAPLTTASDTAADARVDELRRAAATASGHAETAVEVYGPGQATVAAMRSVLARLSRTPAPAVLVIAGAVDMSGSLPQGLSDGTLRYLLSDGTLSAREVSAIMGDARHVIWLLELNLPSYVVHRDVAAPASRVVEVPNLALPVFVVTGRRPEATTDLLTSLPGVWEQGSTFGAWVGATVTDEDPGGWFSPASLQTTSVAAHAAGMSARAALVRARRSTAATAADLVRATIAGRDGQNDPYPEGHLQLGLALAALGRPDEALGPLRTARNLYDDPSVAATERLRDPQFERWQREARYHYGRLLADHGDDLFDAVASLRAAAHDAPDDARIQLHLALALRALVERETLVEARDHARRYLELGAPLGRSDELRDFVLEVPGTATR